MQGTVLMLVALSGLGCHNKSADIVYAPPTYGCYGGGSYASIYADRRCPVVFFILLCNKLQRLLLAVVATAACYGGCYSSCYSGLYSGGYGGHHGCGLLAKISAAVAGGVTIPAATAVATAAATRG